MSMAASPRASEPPLIVVMGVSGCGKTSVGAELAARLGLAFIEGDTMHGPDNIRKMSAGIPLEDSDRWPWLDRIGAALKQAHDRSEGLVVACSALKKSYRDRLRLAAGSDLYFVFLTGSAETLRKRMAERTGHFMPASLLDSQLATLEDPSGEPGVVAAEFDRPVSVIVSDALASLGGRGMAVVTA
jgi:gluconokinase